MSERAVQETIPRPALWFMGGMVAVSLVAAAAGRFISSGTMRVPGSEAIESRDIRVLDRQAGGLEIRDGKSGDVIDVILPGEGGFVRGVMRSFARERRQGEVGSESPVRVLRRQDGRVAIADPVNGREIELNAFGATNVASFAKYLITNPATVKEGKP
jgi:putative photosynthetic complex assembly protein